MPMRSFAPGERVLSLLIGSDRDDFSNWISFAFVKREGIRVWGRYRGTDHETFARMIEQPARWAQKGCEYMAEVCCRRCGRPLTHPESVLDGLGPICRTKV
jgi:hypothetical protein